MTENQSGPGPAASVLQGQIAELVATALSAGADQRDVFAGIAQAFGAALSNMLEPSAAVYFMKRETKRVAFLARNQRTRPVK